MDEKMYFQKMFNKILKPDFNIIQIEIPNIR